MRRSTPTGLLPLGTLLIFTACATIAPPQPPSLELPRPPSDLRATRKGDHVTLTWTDPNITTDRQKIRHVGVTQICRGLATLMECGTHVGEAAAPPSASTTPSSDQKVTRSYVDPLPAQLETNNPFAVISYAVEVLNMAGRGAGLSNQARVPLVRTLPAPQDFAAHVTAQGVVLSWTNKIPAASPTSTARYVYRVYRRPEGSSEQILVGEIPAGSERSLSLTDSGIEWEKTYEYRAETVTVIAQENKPAVEVDGDDTPETKVLAHDVFPPAIPAGLQAVSSGPGQKPFVDLVWAPVTDLDLEGYNVYRYEGGEAPVKVSAEPVKTPAYRDANVISGKRYFYSVSAVDVRDNESARSEKASEMVP
jgi:hypothetical protein